MLLTQETLEIVVLVSAGTVVVLGLVVLVLGLRLRSLRRAYRSALEGEDGSDLFEILTDHRGRLDDLREDVSVVHANTETLRDLLRATVSRVGVVRYDAFEDMGGALSFSAALLDEDGNGVVLSAINGRNETRTYAKRVERGSSEHNLSPEEQAAIEAATFGESDRSVPERRRRRGRAAS